MFVIKVASITEDGTKEEVFSCSMYSYLVSDDCSTITLDNFNGTAEKAEYKTSDKTFKVTVLNAGIVCSVYDVATENKLRAEQRKKREEEEAAKLAAEANKKKKTRKPSTVDDELSDEDDVEE